MLSSTLLWLSDTRCQVAANVGNKAAVLARLTADGYNVPNGFCIPAAALSGEQLDAPTFDSAVSWRQELNGMLQLLPAPWAVRSSSTAAGFQEAGFSRAVRTVLGIASEDALIRAVNHVLASKDAEMLQRYSQHHGFNVDDIHMAVLIQTLINASCSGVAFSHHPVTGERVVTIEPPMDLVIPL